MTAREYIKSRHLSVLSYDDVPLSVYQTELFRFNYNYIKKTDIPLPAKKIYEFDYFILTSGNGINTTIYVVNEIIKLL